MKGFAADLTNSFQISQPEKYAAQGEENRFDHSDQFTVLDDIASRYLKTQEQISHRQTYHMWKLGVGIGVGVGVPILMVVSMVMLVPREKGQSEADPEDRLSKGVDGIMEVALV